MKLKVFTFFILIFYKLLLDVVYKDYIVKVFGEFKLTWDTNNYFLSSLAVIVLSLVLVIWLGVVKKPSYIIIYSISLFLIFPIISYYGLTGSPTYMLILPLLSILLIIYFVINFKEMRIKYLGNSGKLFYLIIAGISLYCAFNLIIGGGLSRINLNLLKVYEVREEYIKAPGFLMGYILPWTAYSINPLILSFALYKKKRITVILVLLFQVFIYACTGFKTFLFAPLLIFLIHYSFNVKKMKSFLPILTVGLITIILYSFSMYLFRHDVVTGSILVRRNFFVPAQIHFMYFDFFTNKDHPFVYLSDSIFEFFINNPYGDGKILDYLSYYYYGREFGLNVGYIGNAYMHFGIFGVIIFSFILSIILKIYDNISRVLPLSVSMASIIVPGFAFINSGLLTAFVTHGFIFSMLITWLLASKIKERELENK
ncbi:O-antigen polymerase [Macrococcus animalis]|uniref:O-antigen polymerase n=1 Tax=Macrococcus animalis TaxID=3395467 RepID=UPI0039BEC024